MLSSVVFVFFKLDCFLNGLCGGNPAGTISARVGYHVTEHPQWHSMFWLGLGWMIDSAFKPITPAGITHCVLAYQFEKNSYCKFEKGNDLARAVLGILVFISCLILWFVIRVLRFFYREELSGMAQK